MTREEALHLLRLGSTADRLEAAVVLRSAGVGGDAARVRRAILRELDERVRTELVKTRIALEAADTPASEAEEEQLSTTESRADAYARGVQDTTFEIVHELRRLVGFARGSAAGEIPDFANSQTRADFDRLSSLLEAVERLGEVAGVPYSEVFDLGGTIHDLAARVLLDNPRDSTEQGDNTSSRDDADAGQYAILIELLVRNPLMVSGDGGLVELALRNGLWNAVEASLGSEPSTLGETPTIVMNWGTTDIDTWVTIADRGPGLPRELVDPFQFAKTTKAEHLGVGLTLTRRAVTSMGGRVSLENRAEGGALFEVRWPHGEVA